MKIIDFFFYQRTFIEFAILEIYRVSRKKCWSIFGLSIEI